MIIVPRSIFTFIKAFKSSNNQSVKADLTKKKRASNQKGKNSLCWQQNKLTMFEEDEEELELLRQYESKNTFGQEHDSASE